MLSKLNYITLSLIHVYLLTCSQFSNKKSLLNVLTNVYSYLSCIKHSIEDVSRSFWLFEAAMIVSSVLTGFLVIIRMRKLDRDNAERIQRQISALWRVFFYTTSASEHFCSSNNRSWAELVYCISKPCFYLSLVCKLVLWIDSTCGSEVLL